MKALRGIYQYLVPHAIRRELRSLRAAGIRRYLNTAIVDSRIALNKPIVRTKVNHACLYADLRDIGLGRVLHEGGPYEPLETQFLTSILRPGMTFVDIGANIGYFTTLAAQCVGSTGIVLALEPDPYNFSLLKRNVRCNARTHVILCNRALGSLQTRGQLFLSPKNFGDHRMYTDGAKDRRAVPVVVDTLDNVLGEYGIRKVNVIKMDVQGYEYEIAKGMEKTLRESERLSVITEFWPYGIEKAGGSPTDFANFFFDRGFSAAAFIGNSFHADVGLREILRLVPRENPDHPDSSYLNLVFWK